MVRLLLQNNYESNLPIDLLNIPRNQAFRVMMTRHANRIQQKFPKLSKFKHWIIALLTKCHMMNIYFVCNSLRLLNLNEIFFLSFFDGWKIRIKYKRNSLNTFFFQFLSNIYIFHNTKKKFSIDPIVVHGTLAHMYMYVYLMKKWRK